LLKDKPHLGGIFDAFSKTTDFAYRQETDCANWCAGV